MKRFLLAVLVIAGVVGCKKTASPADENEHESVNKIEFEAAIEPLLMRTKVCVERALKDAKLGPDDIDEVVFVGGSTRVPVISAFVEEWLLKKPNKSINPDEAVAVGAAGIAFPPAFNRA